MKPPALNGYLLIIIVSCMLPLTTSNAIESQPLAAPTDTDAKPYWVKDADLLPEFPKPNQEKFLANFKVLQPDGSAYRRPIEDWVGARLKVSRDQEWKDWLAKKTSEVDAWIAKHRDRPEWEAGWSHNFVSPTDGAFLVWTEKVPGEETDTIASCTGESVQISPKIFRAWVGLFRKKHVAMMGEASRLFLLTGNIRYAEWVAGQLDFYADNYHSWGKGIAQLPHSWLGFHRLDDSMLLSLYVEAARGVFDYVSPERRQTWFNKLFKPEVELLDRTNQIVHNIALWQRSAQAQVALLYGDETIWSRVVDGEYGIRTQLRRGVTSDYFWYEQSMDYNVFVVSAMQPLLTLAGLRGCHGRLHEEAAITQNLLLAPFTIRFPDGTLPNPADATKISHVPLDALASIYRILPTTLGIAKARSGLSWDVLVDPPATVASTDLPEVVSRNMETTRFALMKQGPWQVFFHYGQVNQPHAQCEALNWTAFFEDIDISHDPGTVGYGSPMNSDYYREGLSHNVPLVNGLGQQPWKPGTLLRFDADAAVMSAEQPAYRDNATARRTLRISGETLIDESTVTWSKDQLGSVPTKLGLALHLQGVPLLPAAFQPVTVESFSKDRPPPFKYWKDIRAASFTDRAELEVVFPGNRVFIVTFTSPGGFMLYQGSSPDIPPLRRAGFYLEKHDHKTEATFTTTLRPRKN